MNSVTCNKNWSKELQLPCSLVAEPPTVVAPDVEPIEEPGIGGGSLLPPAYAVEVETLKSGETVNGTNSKTARTSGVKDLKAFM